ncbi:hypothetical protein ACFE04_014524 [Oxalis oulophora]
MSSTPEESCRRTESWISRCAWYDSHWLSRARQGVHEVLSDAYKIFFVGAHEVPIEINTDQHLTTVIKLILAFIKGIAKISGKDGRSVKERRRRQRHQPWLTTAAASKSRQRVDDEKDMMAGILIDVRCRFLRQSLT